MNRASVLVVDDKENMLKLFAKILGEEHNLSTAGDGSKALALIAEHEYDVVVTDLKMPGASGFTVLESVKARWPETEVVLMTAYGSVPDAVEAIKQGAYDYIQKPFDPDAAALVVARALERRRLRAQTVSLRKELEGVNSFHNMIGKSPPMHEVYGLLERAAGLDVTVLLTGETGTGKELAARAVHYHSERKHNRFVPVNCGALPSELVESELFGHAKGAFTGASATKPGLFEEANRGTLFLDEVGELPLPVQVKLNRALQDKEIRRVGENTPFSVDVRIIAATHRNLQAMIEDGAFREDLYYRLAVIPLDLPPLRERPEDIPELAERFFLKAKEKHGRPDLTLPASLLAHFGGYRWPGNIRELENVIERLVVLTRGNEITLNNLPEFLRRERGVLEELRLDLPPQGISLDAIEKELILRALKKFDWNQTQAARYLDLSRKTLIYRMEKYDIRREQEPGDPAALQS